MKKPLILAIATTLALSLTVPYTAGANNLKDEIRELREEAQKKKKKQENIQEKIEENEQKQQTVHNQLNRLQESLQDIKENIRRINEDIVDKERELEEAKKKLKAADERVAKRDKLLDERIRLMYENGQVSYLEVLFGAKDFAEFLARFEAIKTIMEQDKKLLVEQKRDRNIITSAKEKIDSALAELDMLKAEAKEQRNQLAQRQEEQQVVLAGLKEENKQLEEMSEQEAQRQREIAAALSEKVAANQAPTVRDGGGTFVWPANATLTSSFGRRWGRMHKGLDLAAKLGTPIVAAGDGVVTYAGPASGYGNKITIAHDNGLTTLYGHMYASGIKVSSGERVKKGEVIAEIGNAGRSTGPHTHFEVLKGATAVNPMNYLR